MRLPHHFAILLTAALANACSQGGAPMGMTGPTGPGVTATPTPAPTPAATPEATARYSIEFQAAWSGSTHPQDFPSNPHFSGLIGATHDGRIGFWAPGAPASEGIRRMAERGSKSPLSDEIEAAMKAGTAEFLLSGDGISLSPGGVSLEFSIARDHPLVTLVTMVAPSPDWFTGVRDLNLVDTARGAWMDELTVSVYPWDAGTDSGATFTSADLETVPRAPVSQITGAPFAANGSVAPLGVFRFRRLP